MPDAIKKLHQNNLIFKFFINSTVTVLTNEVQTYIMVIEDYRKAEVTVRIMEDLFEKIYRENFSRVFAFLFKMTRDTDLSEELTQETFYQAFMSFHRFEGKCDIFTWLASIAKHSYYKYLRKNRISGNPFDFTELEKYFTSKGEVGDNPADAVQKRAMRENVAKSVLQLPEKYRDVVLLRIYADMAFSEIAAALNITENSAKVIFFRAKKKLSEDLEDEITV